MVKMKISPLLCICISMLASAYQQNTDYEMPALSYLPQKLKRCIDIVYKNSDSNFDDEYSSALEDLQLSIKNNGKLASRSIVREGIEEALSILDEYDCELPEQQRKEIEWYLETYLDKLDENTRFIPIQSDDSPVSWKKSVTIKRSRSLEGTLVDSEFSDIINLNNELASATDIVVSGITMPSDEATENYATRGRRDFCCEKEDKCKRGKRGKRGKHGKKGKRGKRGKRGHTGATGTTSVNDPELSFSPNVMISPLAASPDKIFGSVYGTGATGVYTPVINAWSMHPSTESQNPISAQFSIPIDINFNLPTRVDLHFLIDAQAASGSARIQLNANYVTPGNEFGAQTPATGFSQVLESSDFTIVEPVGINNLVYVITSITLDTTLMNGTDWAYLSVTRIAPEVGPEYDADIYLAVVSFIYNEAALL